MSARNTAKSCEEVRLSDPMPTLSANSIKAASRVRPRQACQHANHGPMCHRQGRDQYPLGYVQIVYFEEESIINAVKLADEYHFGFVSTYTPSVCMECYGLMTRHQEVRYQKRTRDGKSSHQKREQWLLCPGELPKPPR